MTHIYALFDDATHNLFYVGHTADLNGRFHTHKNSTAKECRDTCYLEVLESGHDLSGDDELFWITYMKALGCELKNKFYMGKTTIQKRALGIVLDNSKVEARMKALDNMAIEELASKAGCTTATVYNVKKGKSCNKQTAKRIAHALKCKVDELEAKE